MQGAGCSEHDLTFGFFDRWFRLFGAGQPVHPLVRCV
jgi:hypothetical protein